jgi:hypothetical protein
MLECAPKNFHSVKIAKPKNRPQRSEVCFVKNKKFSKPLDKSK